MNKNVDRLIILMAAANFSSSDVKSLIASIHSSDIEDIMKNYNRVRSLLRNIGDDRENVDRDVDEAGLANSRVQRDILKLAKSSNMSPAEAANRLWIRLSQNSDSSVIPEFSNKEGFVRWIARVARAVPPNALLNAAIAEFTDRGDGGSDWRLSES